MRAISQLSVTDGRKICMEWRKREFVRKPVRAVLFDFDGTISTLRCGWEAVMKPLMLEMISGGKPFDEILHADCGSTCR